VDGLEDLPGFVKECVKELCRRGAASCFVKAGFGQGLWYSPTICTALCQALHVLTQKTHNLMQTILMNIPVAFIVGIKNTR
jgi:hypothetical protein